jgi:hypothetical protein
MCIVQSSARVARHRSRHCWTRFPANQLQDDVGVDDDHRSNRGGTSPNSAGNKRHFPESADGVTSIVSAGEPLDRITLEI